MRIERARGTRDFLPAEMRKRREMEDLMRETAERWGYGEVRTPTFELAELFTLKSGEEVLKEMYEFRDKGGRHLALRPELTAPVVRMFVNELKMLPKPTKVYYFGNCFRYEEPQRARYREFWQFGAEIIGSDRPEAQAEIIALASEILKSLGVSKEAELQVGQVGLLRGLLRGAGLEEGKINKVMRLLDKGKREEVAVVLSEAGEAGEKQELAEDLTHLTGLRGEEALKEARRIVLSESGSASGSALKELEELEELLRLLDFYEVSHTLNLGIARGLDYYTGMVFEIYEKGGRQGKLGAQSQICGGGSYRLAALFGGGEVASTGFAFGFDRLVEMFSPEKEGEDLRRSKVVVVPIRERTATVGGDRDGEVLKTAIKIASRLREFVPTYLDVMGRNVGAQMSYANSTAASFAVLVGREEVREGKVTLKNLETGEQESRSVRQAISLLSSSLSSPSRRNT